MLVLSRKRFERLLIGPDIRITIVKVDRSQVRLDGFDALGIDLGRVHSGRPEVTDDLVDTGRALLGRGLFGQLALHRG